MKSKKAKEAIERYRKHSAGCISPEEIAEYCRLFGEVAEIAEQDAEERLTRWHDPHEELPEPRRDVLVRYELPYTLAECYYDVGFHDGTDWSIGTDAQVIGWREIPE